MESGVVKTTCVKVGGREFTLAFTLRTMLRMQETIEGFDFNDIGKLVSRPEGLLDALYLLAETGEKLDGRDLDVDKEWFALRIPASIRKMISLQLAVMEAITAGMTMETEEDDDRSREVDVVLQEIQKKSGSTGSHGGKSSLTD